MNPPALPPADAPQPPADQAPREPGSDVARVVGPIGPYWDALRKLKRVRVGGVPSSGIVISRTPDPAIDLKSGSRAP
jgi:hypothetical protein